MVDPEHEIEGWHPIGFPASVTDGEGLRGQSQPCLATRDRAVLLESAVLEPGKGYGDVGGGQQFWAPAHPVTCRRAVLVWTPAKVPD